MNREAVDRLFAAALELPVAEREGLLHSEPDETVRAAVRRLLSRHDHLETAPDAAGFLARLDLELAAQLVEVETTDPATIGRFVVLRRLGTGATGVVYLARDPDLRRDVAIKLLAAELGNEPAAVKRFHEEARAASGVDHPHVVTVYETGRTIDDRLYIVMAHHDGETLRERIARGALPPDEALRIAAQVCDGLTSAHVNGVVHCDIKPENILLTARGARIVDFGIARVAGDAHTRGGGTVAYMSPEQTRGEDIDHRTDLWSLGVALHEMLAGTRPFRAEGRLALLERIRNEEAPPLPAAVPDAAREIVARCLGKERDERYASADELLAALSLALEQRDTRPAVTTFMRPRVVIAVSALLLVVTAMVAGFWRYWPGDDVMVDADGPVPGVAVLPWRTVGPDVEYLGEGMVDLLSFGVEGVAGLRKIDPSSIVLASRAHGELDEASSLAIAQRMAARYLITGSVVQTGNAVRMSAEVRDVESGRLRGNAEVTGPIDSVPVLVDRLTLEMLRLELLPADRGVLPVNLGTITTASLPALKEYLAGERQLRVAHWPEAAQHFLRALEHDSTFAHVLYRLVKANDWGAGLGDSRPWLARLAPQVDKLPERTQMLIIGEMEPRIWPERGIDPLKQIELLESMLRRYPDDVEGWVALGDRYYHDRGQLLLPADAHRRAFRKALDLNPNFREPYLHLIEDAFSRLDRVEVRELVAAANAVPGGDPRCSFELAYHLAWGTATQRQRAMAALDAIPLVTVWRDCLPTTAPVPAPPEVREKLAEVYARISDTALVGVPRFGTFNVFRTRVLIPQGRIRELREALRVYEGNPEIPLQWPERWQLMLHLVGFTDSIAARRAAVALDAGESLTGRFWAGMFAIAEERWDDAERTARWFDNRAAALTEAGNRGHANTATMHGAALRAYRNMTRGGDAERLALEAVLQRMPFVTTDEPQAVVRYLTGKLLIERGNLDQARRYFTSFGAVDLLGQLADLQLGRTAALQGRHDEAAEHFRRVEAWWQDADPEVKAMLEEVRGVSRPRGASGEFGT